MASPSPAPRIIIDNTFGASFIGVVIAAALWGVTAIQTWFYYSTYPRDNVWLKLLVGVTFVFDTVHQALITHSVYYYVISNYDYPLALVDMVWSILLEIAFTAYALPFTGLLVQGFLTYRCWRLSNKNWLITGVIALVVLYEFVASIVFTVLSMRLKTFMQLLTLKPLSMSINIAGAVGSVLIAMTLVYTLSKSRTGFRRSDNVITKLILFSVNTGVIISICACLSLITIIVFDHALIYAAFYFLLGRLYSNTMLATLNARRIVRGDGAEANTMSVSLQNVSKTGVQTMSSTTMHPNISIKVDTTHEYSRDPDYTVVEKDYKIAHAA